MNKTFDTLWIYIYSYSNAKDPPNNKTFYVGNYIFSYMENWLTSTSSSTLVCRLMIKIKISTSSFKSTTSLAIELFSRFIRSRSCNNLMYGTSLTKISSWHPRDHKIYYNHGYLLPSYPLAHYYFANILVVVGMIQYLFELVKWNDSRLNMRNIMHLMSMIYVRKHKFVRHI